MPTPLKDPAVRQRRNKTSTAATLATDEKRKAPMPSLPKHPTLPDWNPLTRVWWKDAWHSPMAVEFIKADYHGLVRLAILIDQFWTDSNPKLAGEIRQEQQAYGLSPLDRKRLQWTVAKTEEATKRQPVKSTRGAEPPDDPRKILEFPA